MASGLELASGSLPALAHEVSVYFGIDKDKLRNWSPRSKVKAANSIGPLERGEWEGELAGEEWDLNSAKDTRRT